MAGWIVPESIPNNRAEAVAVALAESLLPPLLEKIIQDSPEQIWDGTATEPPTVLNLIADQAMRRQQGVARQAASPR